MDLQSAVPRFAGSTRITRSGRGSGSDGAPAENGARTFLRLGIALHAQRLSVIRRSLRGETLSTLTDQDIPSALQRCRLPDLRVIFALSIRTVNAAPHYAASASHGELIARTRLPMSSWPPASCTTFLRSAKAGIRSEGCAS